MRTVGCRERRSIYVGFRSERLAHRRDIAVRVDIGKLVILRPSHPVAPGVISLHLWLYCSRGIGGHIDDELAPVIHVSGTALCDDALKRHGMQAAVCPDNEPGTVERQDEFHIIKLRHIRQVGRYFVVVAYLRLLDKCHDAYAEGR